MTVEQRARVVIAAGGLGTRVAGWARYLPKEYWPVDGRPGIVHVLQEAAALGRARAVIVYHPYYEPVARWARQALTAQGLAAYTAAADRPVQGPSPADRVHIDLIRQHGPYADLTSVLNGARQLGRGELFVAFSDNLYPGGALAVLQDQPPGTTVLARPYQRGLACDRGVIIRMGTRMVGLIEKPDRDQAEDLENRYGEDSLSLLEGRARLSAAFLAFAATWRAPAGEPRMSLCLADYAHTQPVQVIVHHGPVIDLGAAQDEPATTATI